MKLGLTLEFHSSPLNCYIQCPVPRYHVKKQFMNAEIQHLLDIRAVEPVAESKESMGFYSILISSSKRFRRLEGDFKCQAIKFVCIVQVIQDAIAKVHFGMHMPG